MFSRYSQTEALHSHTTDVIPDKSSRSHTVTDIIPLWKWLNADVDADAHFI